MQRARENFFSAVSALVPVEGQTKKKAAMRKYEKSLKNKIF